MSIAKKCSINTCESNVKARGYCNKHWYRWYRGQDIEAPTYREKRPAIIEGDIAKIELGVKAKDGYAIVDKEFAWVDKYIWHLNTTGYARSRIGDNMVYLHSLVTDYKYKICDHINRNRLDNRLSNLREVDAVENMRNRTPSDKHKNIYPGVHWEKRRKYWYATITSSYKRIQTGAYDTCEEAISARLHLESIYWG